MHDVNQTLLTALAHHRAGRLEDAEKLYREILSRDPRHADANHMLGVIATDCGHYDAAVELIGRALLVQPDSAEAHYNLGNALRRQGSLKRAAAEYSAAARLKPDYADAFNNLAGVLRELGDPASSVAACEAALRLKPDFAAAWTNLAVALNALGRPDRAMEASRRAIQLNPRLGDAFNNLGVALTELGRVDEAIAAFKEAVRLQPNSAGTFSNVGAALCRAGRVTDALEWFDRAIALKPDEPRYGSNRVYALNFATGVDSAALLAEQHKWAARYTASIVPIARPLRGPESPDRPLRIGYVSPDFRDHVVGRNVLPLIREHDRDRFLTCLYSNAPQGDDLTVQFKSHAHAWREVASLTDAELAQQVVNDGIDILVDLALHMEGNRLPAFAFKPAPIQITFAGYPGGTGLPSIDFRLSDPYLDPPTGETDADYVEKTLRLPHTFWCYDPSIASPLPVNPLPAQSASGITFGCLNNFSKVNPPVLALWSQVLQAVPGSRLLLLAPEGAHRQRALNVFESAGITPERVEFIPKLSRPDYMAQYHRIDLSLDTFPYNGHTTTLDSLWMGVPVVTLVGKTVVGRAGWSQLSNLNLTELAAHTPEQFLQIATQLAADLPRLTGLRQSLRERLLAGPLADAPGFARTIERAFRTAWQLLR